MQDEWQEADSNVEKSVFDEVAQPTLCGLVIHFMLSHWKAILFLVIIIVTGLSLYFCLAEEELSGVPSEEQTITTPPKAIDNMLIEGIYYCEEADGQNEEPFTATVTRSSNGKEHYLLSAQGQVCDFYLDRAHGTITSQILGKGEISIDSVTTEIIIKFNRWILKHSN